MGRVWWPPFPRLWLSNGLTWTELPISPLPCELLFPLPHMKCQTPLLILPLWNAQFLFPHIKCLISLPLIWITWSPSSLEMATEFEDQCPPSHMSRTWEPESYPEWGLEAEILTAERPYLPEEFNHWHNQHVLSCKPGSDPRYHDSHPPLELATVSEPSAASRSPFPSESTYDTNSVSEIAYCVQPN